MTLARRYRIKSGKEFDHTFRFGKSLVGRGEAIKFIPNDLGWLRVGVAVSAKKFPLAVTRNKIKRLILSEAADVLSDFGVGYDVVVIAGANYNKNTKELHSLMSKAFGIKN